MGKLNTMTAIVLKFGTEQDTVGFIIRSNPAITSELICGMVFQGSGCQMNENEIPDWSINIDPNGRPINGSKSLIPNPSNSSITVVHITDTHYDPKYQEGALADCGGMIQRIQPISNDVLVTKFVIYFSSRVLST